MSAATTMRSIFLALSSALLAAPAGAAVSDFRLPAPRETQQPPDRQGPVAPDVPESRRPAPSPTPTPTASTPVPVPMVTPPAIEPPPIAAPPAAISTATPTPRASPARTTADEAELPTSDEAPPISAAVSGEATDASSRVDHPAATSAGPGEDQPGEQSGTNWLWLLGGLLVIAGLAAAAAMAWRRKHARG